MAATLGSAISDFRYYPGCCGCDPIARHDVRIEDYRGAIPALCGRSTNAAARHLHILGQSRFLIAYRGGVLLTLLWIGWQITVMAQLARFRSSVPEDLRSRLLPVTLSAMMAAAVCLSAALVLGPPP